MPKLMEMSGQVMRVIKGIMRPVSDCLEKNDVFMETQLVSPYMALFANIIPTDASFRILDRFLFFGEDALTETICNSLVQQSNKILAF
jgi:hypothetical protein